MYVLIVVCETGGQSVSIHLVNDAGALAFSGPSVHAALSWLWLRGEDQVVAYTDAGPELFSLEPCSCPELHLSSLSLHRSLLAGCSDLPRILGLGLDRRDRQPANRHRSRASERRRRRRDARPHRAPTP